MKNIIHIRRSRYVEWDGIPSQFPHDERKQLTIEVMRGLMHDIHHGEVDLRLPFHIAFELNTKDYDYRVFGIIYTETKDAQPATE